MTTASVLPASPAHALLRTLLGPLVLLPVAAGAVDLSQGSITLHERLNQTYGREAVAFPFTAADKACPADRLTLTGPDGAVPVQLSDIATWPGAAKTIQSATLTFVAEKLDPLASRNYTLAVAPSTAPAITTDLVVKTEAAHIELATRGIGVRLARGPGALAQPVALATLPHPLAAMRLGQNAWQGGGSCAGDLLVTAWETRLTDTGPVFARATVTYTFADGDTATVAATLFAGDTAIRWELHCDKDHPDAALTFRLPQIPGVTERLQPAGYGQWARTRRLPLQSGDKPFCSLSPDSSVVNIFPENPPILVLSNAVGAALTLASRFPQRWVEPAADLTYGGFLKWHIDMIEPMWENWRRKTLPLTYAADGTVTLHATLASGERWWLTAAGAPDVGEAFNQIKDLVLEWPADPKRPQPRGFMDAQTLAAAQARFAADPEAAKSAQRAQQAGAVVNALARPEAEQAKALAPLIANLRTQLDLLGRYDVMRRAIANISVYDMLIDTPHLTAADRACFRAQAAYLGYRMADPGTWSMEHGYCSGNPNMSISYTLSLGVIACVLSDHPMAATWADRATRWMDHWLDTEVGANGEWLPEASHYGFVSLEPMLSYAISAQRAGFHDFTNDSRLKRLLLYFAKMHTPRDPQRGGFRVSGAYGRGTSGDRLGVFALAAKMNADQDPAFVQTMEWMWTEMGYPTLIGDARLGGFEPFYMDRTLPQAAPSWGSELFPQLGTLLRAAFNTPYESYVNLLACVQSTENLDIWTPGVGGISQWFGRGAPLATCFTSDNGYSVRHELLRDGVRLARNWGKPGDPKGPFGHYTETHFGTFAALPTVDYVRTTLVNTKPDDRDWFPKAEPLAYPRVTPAKSGTLTWTRQALLLKDAAAAGPATLVLRDTTAGGEPTAWQFWTLSEKLGAAEEAQDIETFLADKPGVTFTPARRLPAGDRYTALGQRGVDVEYFVSAPRNTPRDTLRYGGSWARIPEYQDLLHLQLPQDGAYFVALFPRPRTEAAPAFTRIGETGIKMTGAFGTDIAFLAHDEAKTDGEGALFEGTAAAVQAREASLTLTLGAPGKIGYQGVLLAAPAAVAATIVGDTATLTASAPHAAFTVSVTTPPAKGGQTHTVDIAADATRVVLDLKN